MRPSQQLSHAQKLAREVGRAAIREGAARTLLLDVDGTLAPIASTPEQAEVPHDTLQALRHLVRAEWTIVPVSGRPAEQVRSMVPIAGVLPFGSHGLEGALDGPSDELAVPSEVLQRLRQLAHDSPKLAAEFPEVRIEHKPAGLAFHDRQLDAGELSRWHLGLERWLATRDLTGLETLHGKRVLEIRPRGANKGQVVRTVAEHLGLTDEDRSFVAIGDDVTDEDMFREIRGLGLGVRVGDESAPSHAELRLDSPRAVADFLAALGRGQV